MREKFMVTVWNAETAEDARIQVHAGSTAVAEVRAKRAARNILGEGNLVVTKMSCMWTSKPHLLSWYRLFTAFNKRFAREGYVRDGIGPRQARFIIRLNMILHPGLGRD